jgi:rod shape-determining protein MreC
MTLGTVDRTPPPLFNQGASALSKFLVLGAMALVLMVLDARLHLAQPVRSVLATALYPLQWTLLQPIHAARLGGNHFASLQTAQQEAQNARKALMEQVQRAALVEHLSQENQSLRRLLGMAQQLPVPSVGAEVLYDAADPYTHKVVLNKGHTHGIQTGSPVVDAYGVLGQVTQTYPLTSEVTLLIDRDQTIPVLNTRTGQRHLAYGSPHRNTAGMLELRFVSSNADIAVDDVLTTSGVDGVYPPGLPVARVAQVDRMADASFARIVCTPTAQVGSALQVLVVQPGAGTSPPLLRRRP